MKTLSITRVLVALALSAVLPAVAFAAPPTGGICQLTDITGIGSSFTLSPFSCASFSGNDAGNAGNQAPVLAWLNGLSNSGTWSYDGTTNEGQTSGPFFDVTNGSSGSFSPDVSLSDNFAITLKGASFFNVYAFNTDMDVTSFNYTMANVASNNPGLSHASLWTGGDFVVPEPASLAILAFGFVGLGVVRRRRRLS